MTDVMKYPTADQLEAGGVINEGTLQNMSIRDWPLTGGAGLSLWAGDFVVRRSGGEMSPSFTITSYTPPEPKQDSGPCFQRDLAVLLNRYCAENVSGTPGFILAEMLTGFLREFNEIVSRRAEWRGESTELPALIDTVPVPREALDKLREAVHASGLYNTGLHREVCDFLAAVDDRSES